jgi:hypothetical protein
MAAEEAEGIVLARPDQTREHCMMGLGGHDFRVFN